MSANEIPWNALGVTLIDILALAGFSKKNGWDFAYAYLPVDGGGTLLALYIVEAPVRFYRCNYFPKQGTLTISCLGGGGPVYLADFDIDTGVIFAKNRHVKTSEVVDHTLEAHTCEVLESIADHIMTLSDEIRRIGFSRYVKLVLSDAYFPTSSEDRETVKIPKSSGDCKVVQLAPLSTKN